PKVSSHMRRLLAGAASLLLFVTVHATERTTAPASIDLVEIDVAVLDRQDKPVTGLTARDFVVKEDGRQVEIKTFLEAQPTSPDDPDNVRSVVLLLDDVAIPAAGTQALQIIGKAFLQSADPHDEVSVVRLHNPTDEAFGDRGVAESRIARFQAAAFPFADFNTASETMTAVAAGS